MTSEKAHGSTPANAHGQATSAYSYRAPHRPMIQLPAMYPDKDPRLQLISDPDDIEAAQLTPKDVAAVVAANSIDGLTDGLPAESTYEDWSSQNRWSAHQILNFAYLGPCKAARDEQWLRKTGITAVVVALDESQAANRLPMIERVCAENQIEVVYQVLSSRGLIQGRFPELVRRINDHLVRVHRASKTSSADNNTSSANNNHGHTENTPTQHIKAKILVACDTGSERSPCAVAAYIMAMYGVSMEDAVKIVSRRRFSANFSESAKGALQSWEDSLRARRSVTQARREMAALSVSGGGGGGGGGQPTPKLAKRSLVEDEDCGAIEMDVDRFRGRAGFAPFVDIVKGAVVSNG